MFIGDHSVLNIQLMQVPDQGSLGDDEVDSEFDDEGLQRPGVFAILN